MVPEMLITLTSSLLTVFSMQVAFLGFLCALFFTKTWIPKVITAFKVLILVFFISVVIMGVTCGCMISISPLQEIRTLPIVIDIVIGGLIIGALFVTIVVMKS